MPQSRHMPHMDLPRPPEGHMHYFDLPSSTWNKSLLADAHVTALKPHPRKFISRNSLLIFLLGVLYM